MTNKGKFDKWLKWLLELIKPDVFNLLYRRRIYNELISIVAEALKCESEKGNTDCLAQDLFKMWLENVYGDSLVVGIGRQLDPDPRSVSLRRLLTELQNDRDVYQAYARSRDFCWIKPGIAELDKAGESLKTWRNKVVAHTDERFTPDSPTFREANAALDVMDKLVCKCIHMLTGSWWNSVEPHLGYNWRIMFKELGRHCEAFPNTDELG